MRLRLDAPPFAERTGRGVRVAVVDSGVASGHPHVGDVEDAFSIGADDPMDTTDRIGHGTAVAAAIREKAPGISLISVRIFHQKLSTTSERLAQGIECAVAAGARVVNLSVGLTSAMGTERVRPALDAAGAAGAIVVMADGPFDLSAVRVEASGDLARDELQVSEGGRLRASPLPRPIPGVPPERNLSGISFAVANVSGFLARLLEAEPELRDVESLLRRLRAS